MRTTRYRKIDFCSADSWNISIHWLEWISIWKITSMREMCFLSFRIATQNIWSVINILKILWDKPSPSVRLLSACDFCLKSIKKVKKEFPTWKKVELCRQGKKSKRTQKSLESIAHVWCGIGAQIELNVKKVVNSSKKLAIHWVFDLCTISR